MGKHYRDYTPQDIWKLKQENISLLNIVQELYSIGKQCESNLSCNDCSYNAPCRDKGTLSSFMLSIIKEVLNGVHNSKSRTME